MAFLSAAAEAYGDLPDDWPRLAQLLDLGNLAGLLSNAAPGGRRARDVEQRIRQTLEDEAAR